MRNAIRVLDQHDRALYIGADRTGRLLEVVVDDDDGQPVAIHAMTLRPKLYEHLSTHTRGDDHAAQEQLQQAAEDAERWLDSLDPAAIASLEADASWLRRIGDAVRAAAASQAQLGNAVPRLASMTYLDADRHDAWNEPTGRSGALRAAGSPAVVPEA